VLAETAAAPGALRPSRLSWPAQPGVPVTRRRGMPGTAGPGLRRPLLAGHSRGVSADLSPTCYRPPTDLACIWRSGPDAGGRSNILVTCAFPPRVADVTCDGPQGGSSGVISRRGRWRRRSAEPGINQRDHPDCGAPVRSSAGMSIFGRTRLGVHVGGRIDPVSPPDRLPICGDVDL